MCKFSLFPLTLAKEEKKTFIYQTTNIVNNTSTPVVRTGVDPHMPIAVTANSLQHWQSPSKRRPVYFVISLWLWKVVTADVTAVFVNNQHGIQLRGPDDDKNT